MKKSIASRTDAYLHQYARYLNGDQVYGRLGPEFLDLLGCPYVSRDKTYFPVVEPANLGAARLAIPKILTALGSRALARVDVSSLVAGLNRNNCWGECLNRPDDAYALVLAVMIYIDMYHTEFELDVVVEPDVCELLTSWLRPSEPWTKIPTALEVCQHMFGEAWSGLASAEEAVDLIIYEVRRQRPPFLPGLCPLLEPESDLPLPLLQELAP